MLLIAGTAPIKDLPLIKSPARIEDESLIIAGQKIPCSQGTGAMISAAIVTSDYMHIEPPEVILAGDIGEGKGSKSIYKYLIDNLPSLCPDVLALHYLLPIMSLMEQVVESSDRCNPRPILIGDAGSMYAAKAAGLAPRFDIFTPDAGELSFLADPDASHPAYIAHHLFRIEGTDTSKLIEESYRLSNAPRVLLTKGIVDHVAEGGEIVATIDEPNIPQMEAIGGTGDTITGVISAFVHAGLEVRDSAILAARANRMAGRFASPTQDTKIWGIIRQFPEVFNQYLCQWTGICYNKNFSEEN